MDINGLLKPLSCACGKTHFCDIEQVFIEKNAILRLKDALKNYKNILVVADENTFGAAGEKTLSVLTDKNVKTVIFSGKTVLVPNEDAVEKVNENIENTQMIIGIGSGVIQDLCKYVSGQNKIPYLIVATAPSMDGYASDGAAMILKGMKETVKSGLPRMIIADTLILKDAPLEMIKSGYGDIIGKFSALNDWQLSACVNNEYFCQYIYDLTFEQIQKTLSLADGIKQRDEESIKALMEALVIVGILMSFAGSSRPASGSEHHFSHFFEITGILNATPYLSHGIDVAYSTVITAKIRQDIVNRKFPDKLFRLSKKDYENVIQNIYSSCADGCIKLQEKIGNYNDKLGIYLEKEQEIKDILKECPQPEEIIKMLEKVDLNIQEFYDIYTDKQIENAILYSKDLKDRYTVLWLNYDLFGTP